MRGQRDPEGAEDARRLCEALCSLGDAEEAAALLADLCSPSEVASLAQRLEVAHLLDEGRSYLEVSRLTGASSTTVSRVSKCLRGGAGGYRLVLARLGATAGTGGPDKAPSSSPRSTGTTNRGPDQKG